jgi:hypothetical protein
MVFEMDFRNEMCVCAMFGLESGSLAGSLLVSVQYGIKWKTRHHGQSLVVHHMKGGVKCNEWNVR